MCRPTLPLLAIVLPVLFGAAPASGFETGELTSPGGIAFSHMEIPGAESVSVQVAWPSDWAYAEEPAGTPYIGAELLPAGGAGGMGPTEVQQAFEELQAEGGLNVVADHVLGHLDARARDLDAAIELGATVLTEPAFDERWFGRVRDGFASNVTEARRESGARVGDLLRRLALGEGELQRFLSLRPIETLTEVTLDDVRRWHETTLVRRGMVVAVAGGIDAEAAGEAVDALLGALPAGEGTMEAPSLDPDAAARRVVLHDPEAGKSVVALHGPMPPTSGGGDLEDILAVIALGGGDGSRLHEALRTELRASYDVQALLENRTRALRGLLLYAEVDTDKLTEARRTLRETYAGFVADGPTETEIETARAALAEGLRQMLGTPSSAARSLIEAALDAQPAERVPALPTELETITAASVRERLSEAFPAEDELLEVVLTPDADAPEGDCVIASIEEAGRCVRP